MMICTSAGGGWVYALGPHAALFQDLVVRFDCVVGSCFERFQVCHCAPAGEHADEWVGRGERAPGGGGAVCARRQKSVRSGLLKSATPATATHFNLVARNANAHAGNKSTKRPLKYSMKLLARRPPSVPVSPHFVKNSASRRRALSSVCKRRCKLLTSEVRYVGEKHDTSSQILGPLVLMRAATYHPHRAVNDHHQFREDLFPEWHIVVVRHVDPAIHGSQT